MRPFLLSSFSLPPPLPLLGGINEHVQTILSSCSEKNIPVVFALTRRGLGWVLRKPHRVGCVGIFSYAGSEVGEGERVWHGMSMIAWRWP